MSPHGTSLLLRMAADYIRASRRPSRRAVVALLGSLDRALRTGRQATMRPSLAPEDGRFDLSGKELPPFFHAAKAPVTKINPPWEDPSLDRWYGQGFYAAFDPEYVRRWYGPVVTRLRAKPDAKVLAASVSSQQAPPGLVEKVEGQERARIGDDEKFPEMWAFVLENPFFWVHAIDRMAIEEYDVVLFNDEQIVVKNPDAVVIEGEQEPPAA